jgi:hypothetical protein
MSTPIYVSRNSNSGYVTTPQLLDYNFASKLYVDSVSSQYSDTKQTVNEATSTDVASTLVKRDGSGQFSASQIILDSPPTQNSHATTKSYVDAFASGITYKEACDYKTVGPLPSYTKNGVQPAIVYTADANGILTIDGTNVSNGDRILLDQSISNPSDAGIFVVTDAGSASTPWILTRSDDTQTMIQGTVTYVLAGATALNSQYAMLTNNVIVGTTSQNWAKLSDAGSSSNVPNSLVRRGATGEFSAGTVTVDTVQCTGAASANSITTNGITVGNADQPGSLAVSGPATIYNYTPATDTTPQSSPFLLLKGKIYNTTLPNSRYMTGGIQVNSVTQNTDPTTCKMSFTVDSDNADPSEKAYLTSDGDFAIIGKLNTPAFQMVTDAGAGKLFTSDASGNASWVTPTVQNALGAVTLDTITFNNAKFRSIVFGYSDADPLSSAFNGIGVAVAGMRYSVASNTVSHSFYRANGAAGTPVELMTIGGNGTVSIPATSNLNVAGSTTLNGMTMSPNGQINWGANTSAKMVALFDGIGVPTDNTRHDYLGLGVSGSTMRYHVHATTADHVFFAATGATTSNEVLRVKGNGSGIMLPTTGGTATPFGYYEEYDHVTTFTGPNTSPSLTLKITRIGRQVHCLLPSHWAPSTVSTAFFMTVPFPARFRHNMSPVLVPLIVTHSGVYTTSMGLFSADGTVQICATPPNGSFPVSGHSSGAGWHTSTISWTV